MGVSGIYALNKQETSRTVSTNIVDIEVTNYKLNDDNQEIEYNNQTTEVMPGDEVPIIPKVSNHGMECYLRIKVQYINDNVNFLNYVTGFSENFTKHGSYYYYNKLLQPNESLKIFETIKIPEDIHSKTDSTKVQLVIIAEAIQGKNFEPDYSLVDPWKNVQPEVTVNNTYDIDEDSSRILVNYENNTDQDILVPSNFFEQVKKMVPGDSFSDSIDVKNTNRDMSKYYWEITTDNNNEGEKLLKQLHLTITTSNDEVLYDGSLLANTKIMLGEYKLGEQEQIYFNVSAPFELNNQYENLISKLILTFSAEYNTAEESPHKSKIIKTGDTIDLAITIFVISALGLITVMLLLYVENRKSEN